MNRIDKTSEDMYSKMDKNTVSSKNQLKGTEYVRFINLDGNGKKIMFVGNSITLHGILPSIGWHNEWGMAASAQENDYVHILMNKINEIYPNSQYCICQVAEWESDYKNGTTKHCLYENAKNFEPDLIIMRFVENCPRDEFDCEKFKMQMDALLSYLNKSGKAKIIMTTGFWYHPGDNTIIEYAKENGLPSVVLGDLGEQDEMKAIGLFEHGGVANHPGDLGMKTMAERIFAEVKK